MITKTLIREAMSISVDDDGIIEIDSTLRNVVVRNIVADKFTVVDLNNLLASKLRYGTIIHEDAGVISNDRVWVCLSEGYMYTADTFNNLLIIIDNEWKNDKHLVG